MVVLGLMEVEEPSVGTSWPPSFRDCWRASFCWPAPLWARRVSHQSFLSTAASQACIHHSEQGPCTQCGGGGPQASGPFPQGSLKFPPSLAWRARLHLLQEALSDLPCWVLPQPSTKAWVALTFH